MRKPPWWVRSVFQCALCTRLCASWSRGFVWLRKHKVTRQTPVTFPWEVYLQGLANAERPFVIAGTVVPSLLSFFLHNRAATQAPRPLDLNSDMGGGGAVWQDVADAFTSSLTAGPGSWRGRARVVFGVTPDLRLPTPAGPHELSCSCVPCSVSFPKP